MSTSNSLGQSAHVATQTSYKELHFLRTTRCEEQGQETKAYLTDECTELTRSETIVDTSEDGNGDYNVAEETSKVVKGVYPD